MRLGAGSHVFPRSSEYVARTGTTRSHTTYTRPWWWPGPCPLSTTIQFLSLRPAPSSSWSRMGSPQVRPPSVDTLTVRPLRSALFVVSSNTSEFAYTTLFGPNATTASEARSNYPPTSRVSFGRSPWIQCLPPSNVVAQPLSSAPPPSTRPSWYTATALSGFAGFTAIEGSIVVSGCSGGWAFMSSEPPRPSVNTNGFSRGLARAVPGPTAAPASAATASTASRTTPGRRTDGFRRDLLVRSGSPPRRRMVETTPGRPIRTGHAWGRDAPRRPLAFRLHPGPPRPNSTQRTEGVRTRPRTRPRPAGLPPASGPRRRRSERRPAPGLATPGRPRRA